MSVSRISVLRALEGASDDRGYVRTTLDQLALDTELSRKTVQRALTDLVAAGEIRRRSVDGRSGGLLIRLENQVKTRSKPGQNQVKNDLVDHVVQNQNPCPEGAGGVLVDPPLPPETRSPSTSSRGPAYRDAKPHETPQSGAEFVYTGDSQSAQWRRLHATVWIAPNGDAVSIRSMTPELRLRLRVDLNEDGTPCIEAVRAIRGMLE